MGVALREIVEVEELEWSRLNGRTIAIDAFNTLYQFLSIIRQRDGTPLQDSQGRITSHLSGLFYRSIHLRNLGIKPIYVFDGKPPEEKQETLLNRHEVKIAAEKKWKAAKEAGDFERARSAAQATSRLTAEMIGDSKTLLDALGLPWVQAPAEGEAQAALICLRGDAYAVGSQDWDALLFGALRIVRNINLSGKRKVPGRNLFVDIHPELVELQKTLAALAITREQLIALGLLVGTDYNPQGIKGVGPKKALDLVKKNGDFDSIFSKVQWDFSRSPQELKELFLHPTVDGSYKIVGGQPNPEKIRELLCEEHDFSVERVENTLAELAEVKGSQPSLAEFL